MRSFLSDTNRLYLRHAAHNVVATSSEDERILQDWNPEENYLDLSPDEEKDTIALENMIKHKWMMLPDTNSPIIGEQFIQNCFAVGSSEKDLVRI